MVTLSIIIKTFFTFSNKIEDVITEETSTAVTLESIGEHQQPQDLEKAVEEKYWLDTVEIDPEYFVNILRYAFAVCLIAVSAKILFNVLFPQK